MGRAVDVGFSYDDMTDETQAYYEQHLATQAERFFKWCSHAKTRQDMPLAKSFALFWGWHRRSDAFRSREDEDQYKADLIERIDEVKRGPIEPMLVITGTVSGAVGGAGSAA